MKFQIKTIILFILLINNLLLANQIDDLKKVTLQLEWKHQFEFAGFYAAIEKGYYKDVGLELEIKEFQEGINITQEVLSGNATFGISSSALILEKLNKKPVVLIASYFKQNALALVTKPNIKTPADLKNKKIMAVDWEMGHTSLGVILKDAGITSNDYTLVNHDFKVDKFVSGEVDAMSVFTTSQPYELDKLGVKYNILNPANFGIYSYDVELFTSEDIINSDTQKVKNFVEATNKGWEYAFKNKEEIVDLIYNKYSKKKSKESLLFEANQTEKIFKTNVFKIGAIAPELIKLNADMYTNLNLVDKDYDITTILNNYYFDINNKIQNVLTNEEKSYIKNSIIKVHNELNWPPFNYNINGKATGYSIDYMNLLASKVGLNVEYISGPNWNDFLGMMKDNKLDVMLNIAKTEDREKYLNFTTPYLKAVDSVFVRKEVNNLKSLEDFKGKTLAVIDGFYEEELFRKYYPEIKLLLVKDSLDGLKKLAFKESDGFIDSFAVANYFIENNFIINLKPAFEIKDQRFNLSMGLATNKDNKLLQEILDKAKKEITIDEEFELKRKWINTNNIGAKSTIPFSMEEEDYLSTKKVITMCVDPDWEPFEILDKNGKHVGIAADIIKLITSKLGIEIKIIPTKTWEESIEFSKAKKCDILSFLNQTPQRESWLTFTEPIFQDPNVIIARNEFPQIKDLSLLENKTIAIPSNTAMYEYFQKDFPNLQIIPVSTEAEAFSLVENNKVDLTIRSLIIAAYSIKKENLFNLKIVAQPLKYKNMLRMGIIKDEPILRDILNKAIKKITKEEQEEIISRHVSIKIPDNNENFMTFVYIMIFILFIIAIILLWNYQLRKRIAEEIKKNLLQQELMFQQNKKAELGNLIGNISHQWRDSLTKIGYINLNIRARILQKKEISNKFLDESTNQIEKSLDFMSETMQNFLDYYKPSSNISNFEVYDSIKSALTIIDTKIKYSNLEITFYGHFGVKIEGIRNEWMQVWINLIINTINVISKREIPNPKLFINIENSQIAFEDNCGKIENEILEQINKNNFKGLGIKMSKEIASKNGKNMIIENGKQGAIFKFI